MSSHCNNHGKTINNKKGLSIAIVITAVIMVLEFLGGLATNSLALLSDAGHMLSDVSSLVFSLLAMWLARKPPTDTKHFGFHRVEILAALFNGITLFVIASLIIMEAYDRFLAVAAQPVCPCLAHQLSHNLLRYFAAITWRGGHNGCCGQSQVIMEVLPQ